jgi:hypothetical protein
LHPHLCAEAVTLSDRYPVARPACSLHGGARLRWHDEPLDARAVPPRPGACRTIFSSFHHFDRRDARRILQDAVAARAPIAIFEFTERTFARLWRLTFAPLLVWCDTWRMRPRGFARVFWTYVVPVVPLIYTWDSIVSHLRTYSTSELATLTDGLAGHTWEIGAIPTRFSCLRILYVVGLPASG